MLNITRGKVATATKAVIYGPEGVGKSTLAKGLRNPVFVDVEMGTSRLDVARTPNPTSWTHMIEILRQLSQDPQGFETVVIDTADWAEKLAIQDVCGTLGVTSLGGQNDYGKTYNELSLRWCRLLDMLNNDFIARGLHVVFLAHSTTKNLELPEEEGKFDRYELGMEKRTSKILKEWPDDLLFCNYKTIVTVTTNKEGKVTSAKGQGGTRRMCYAQHAAAWDAKNRDDLPPEFDMDAGIVLKCFPKMTFTQKGSPAPAPTPAQATAPAPVTSTVRMNLAALMETAGIAWPELLAIMVERGKAAAGTEFENLNESLINQWVVPHWEKISAAINAKKETITNV